MLKLVKSQVSMDLFTKFYNIKGREYVLELQKGILGACKRGSHETVSGKLVEPVIPQVIELEDQQLTFIEH